MNEAHEAQRVIRADKRLRVFVVAAWIVSVAAGAPLILWVLPWGRNYIEGRNPEEALRIIRVLISLIFLSVVPLAVYLFWFGRRAVNSGQMPPPGTRVVVDTRVIEGDRARTRGRAIMVIAAILLALGLLGGVWLPYRLGQVFADEPQERMRELSEQAEPATPPAGAANR